MAKFRKISRSAGPSMIPQGYSKMIQWCLDNSIAISIVPNWDMSDGNWKIEIKINKFNICCPGKVIGDPDINPLNFRKAIIEPEKVIAPTAAPIDISIRLASLIFPDEPKLKTSGLKKADIATNTAAKPTKL